MTLVIKEIYGLDIGDINTSYVFITTNGTLTKNRTIVTGAGVAQWITEVDPDWPYRVGNHVHDFGNTPYFDYQDVDDRHNKYCSFPVKHNWWETASFDLIRSSMIHILRHWNYQYLHAYPVFIPFPGCGNGKLQWEAVKQELLTVLLPAQPYLQGEIVFFTKGKKK